MSGGPGTRGWFESYLAAFNASDFDAFGAFYSADVEFLGRAAELRGRDAVLAFYRGVHARVDERIELTNFVGSRELCAAEIVTNLLPLEDWPDFPTGALVRGQARRSVNFVFYDLRGSQFTRIRSAGFRPLAHPLLD